MHRSDPSGGSMPFDQARAAFVVSPFTRLARTHALSIGGDALFTMGLAGTVFFDTDLDAARLKVALTLLLTIAPFAVAAPLIGPTLDRMRGGRRGMILATCLGRALVSLLLVWNFDNLAFYPLAFAMLVLGKSYTIAKSALVPTTVHNDAELVEANSKLSLVSGLAVVVAAVPGSLFWRFGGSEWVVGLAVAVFVAGAVLAVRLPNAAVASSPADDIERQELRGAGILLAASAMGLLRGVVGFLSFLLAFTLKDDGAWMLGVVAAAAQAGFLAGAAAAPRLRRLVQEEHILISVLVATTVLGLGAALTGGLVVAAVMSFAVGAGSSAGKQAFDAIVQRDAPDANRGRSFARFETRFQLLWVIGALVPVALTIPARLGFVMIAACTAFGSVSYAMGVRSASMRAAAFLRGLRRQQRAAEDVAPSRDLGFDLDLVGEGSIPGGETNPITGGHSAAARRGTRRRSRPMVAPPDPEHLGDDVPDPRAPAPGLDRDGPDLEWHPDC